MKFRFPLYDFLGRVKSYFLVDESDIGGLDMAPKPQPGHMVFVLDMSGSMYNQYVAVKSFLVKLLTLEEYRDTNLLVSIVSFASKGDLRTHASRVPITEFMAADSKALAAVQALTPRGATCMSQGLRSVEGLMGDERTAVLLISDGYANDESPGSEKRIIDTLVTSFQKDSRVFVNTVSLGDWADFKLLSYIANACSGTCFSVPSAKEVYDVLHDTTSLVAGQTQPALDVPMNGANYAVFLSTMARKLIGGSADFMVRGLRPEDTGKVWRFKAVEQSAYDASNLPEAPAQVALAFAKAQLAEGYVNTAKYALVTSRDQTLLSQHARALVNTEIAAMSGDVEACALHGIPSTHEMSATPGLPNADVLSVLGVLSILTQYPGAVEVHIPTLRASYKKRGIGRVAGTRNEDGTITRPRYKTAYRDDGAWGAVSSVDINRNNATANMLIIRDANLVDVENGDTVISEVAGVKLNLKSYNNYTLVGDGALNVKMLPLRIGNKRLHRALVSAKVLPDTTFDPKAVYEIVLDGRPLVAYDATFNPNMLDGVFMKVARMKALSSILAACLKGESDSLTEEQVAALKAHCLSPALYFSAPTTTPYADLQQALVDGTVDTRVSYKVDFGTPQILNLSALKSANAFLERRFTLTRADGSVEPKPKMDMRWEPRVTFGIKALSARIKLDAVDDLQFPIMADFLGLTPPTVIPGILADAGLDADFAMKFRTALGGQVSKDTAVEVLTDARKAIDTAIDRVFDDQVSPMVFYVGATGLLPDEFNARAMTAEQVSEKYPDLKLGKDASEGTFYVVGETIVVIFPKVEYFSTGKEGAIMEGEEVA